MSQEQSFFARRRAGLKAEREAELVVVPEEPVTPEEVEPDLSEMSDTDILELLDLPDPDTLRKGDNFAAFMAKAVPMHLRNRALRNLWRSDPVLACLDGLNDYDTDYLTGSTGQGVIKTSYQVGRGLLAHVEKMAEEAAAKDAEVAAVEADTQDTLSGDDAIADDMIADANIPSDGAVGHIADHDALDDADDADVPAARAPRRMRFEFGDRT
jgi:hypothetical protein